MRENSRIIMLALAALIAISSCSGGEMEQSPQRNEPGTLQISELLKVIPALDTGRLLQVEVRNAISCNGIIEIPPTDLFSVHSRAEGYVSEIQYITGDKVSAGALLFRVSNPQFIATQRELLQLRAELELAGKRFERQQVLSESDATSSKQYDEVLGMLQLKQASYEGLSSELEATGFDVEAITGNMEFQQTLDVRAPVTGFIHAVNINTGQKVEPSDELMRIAGTDHIHLELHVLEKDILKVGINDSVRFTTQGFDEVLTAKVVKVNSVLDETGSALVHCHIDDAVAASRLKAGMFAEATVYSGADKFYGLPEGAVIKEGLKHFAYRVTDALARKTELENARVSEGYVVFDPDGEQLTSCWVTSGAYYIE